MGLEQWVLDFAIALGAEWVLLLLLFLSVICGLVTAERIFYLGTTMTNRPALSHAINAFLAGGPLLAMQQKIYKLSGFEANIIAAGLRLADEGPQAAQKAMEGTATAERLKMERGLAVLATVGANAPFIGLFGTVLGIIRAFRDLAENTAEASEAVMSGIAEALVATAVGLVVAIPAVVLYNAFSRCVKARMGRAESVSDLVLARLTAMDRPASGSAAAPASLSPESP